SSSRVYRVAADRVSTSYRAMADRVSSSRAYRAAADRVSASYQAAADRASASLVYRATTDIARKHSRVSVIAASVAAVVVLGATGFAVGAERWGQAVGTVAETMQGHASSASGQPGASLFEAITGTKAQDGKPLAGGQLNTIRSATALGNTKAAAAAAQHQ